MAGRPKERKPVLHAPGTGRARCPTCGHRQHWITQDRKLPAGGIPRRGFSVDRYFITELRCLSCKTVFIVWRLVFGTLQPFEMMKGKRDA